MSASEDNRNAAIIAALREEFVPLVERLTGEIEPAVSYTLTIEESAPEE